MNINQINNAPKFKGYSNVLYTTVKNDCEHGLSMMAMHLDNIGKNDLEQWHNFQKKVLLRTKPKDTLVISVINDEYNRKNIAIDQFFINSDSVDIGKAFDKNLLKVLIFIKSLTDRIKSAVKIVSDGNFNKTLDDMTKVLSNITLDNISSRLLAIEGIKPDSMIIEAAKEIDENVADEIGKIYDC